MTIRLLQALLVVWQIFASYALQFALERLFRGKARGERGRRSPARWLQLRRQRTHERNAERLLAAILRLKGVYVKLGQVLSIMVGLLPGVYRRKLAPLQDAVPPRPFSEIEQAFFESLGRYPGDCFAEIEREPLAAASLGQVHVAWLPDGRKVAVKVLGPNVRAIIAVDMRVLGVAARLFERFLPVRDLETVHAALADLLWRETDYTLEAENMRRIACNFADETDVLVPEVVDQLSSREVLTMTFMSGIKITHVESLEQVGIDPESVGRRLLQCFFEQLFVHRCFHADPHPGNFLVQEAAQGAGFRLVLLDFGTVSDAPEGLVEGLLEALVAFFSRDGDKLMQAFDRMGFVAAEADRTLVQQTVLKYFERLLALGARTPRALLDREPQTLRRLLDPELELRQLRDLARSFRSPDGWFLIERTLVMMFGLCGDIAPELDMLQVAFPYVMPLLQAQSERHQAG